MPVRLVEANTDVTLADLVGETTTTEGTGTYVLNGALTGFRGFVDGAGSGASVVYASRAGSTFEIGTGVVTEGSPDTLSRAFILENSSGTSSAISWPPGEKIIKLVAPASLLMQIIDPARVTALETAITVVGGSLHGLGTSQAADTDHDITIAAGSARDSTNVATMTLAATLTKRIDAAWVVGTNQGGLDTGTVANNTWYAVWVIRRSGTGVVDALFSVSGTAPTMPASYNQRRRIGWVRTDGSANILAYFQRGDRFQWAVPFETSSTIPSSASGGTTYSVRCPPQLGEALVSAYIQEATLNDVAAVWFFDPAIADAGLDPDTTAPRSLSVKQTAGTASAAGFFIVGTNSSGQIRAKSGSGNVPTAFSLWSEGWLDRRGRDA